MIVPIGSWCRTAFQVNQYCLKHAKSKNFSYPFDWTISPFHALKFVLSERFEVDKALGVSNLSLNSVGSLTDLYTGILHHHDFISAKMHELITSGRCLDSGIPDVVSTGILEQAKSRFVHCFNNLLRLRDVPRFEAIGFVRWIRHGHPDKELPNVFEGETIGTVNDVIRSFLGHDSFFVLQITTSIASENHSADNPISEVLLDDNMMGIHIIERKGFDGTGDNDFRGDTRSWEAALDLFLKQYNLNLNLDPKLVV